MEKRLPLALFLSFLVLFGWQMLFGPDAPPPGEQAEVPVAGDVGDPAAETLFGETAQPANAEADTPDEEPSLTAPSKSAFIASCPGL